MTGVQTCALPICKRNYANKNYHKRQFTSPLFLECVLELSSEIHFIFCFFCLLLFVNFCCYCCIKYNNKKHLQHFQRPLIKRERNKKQLNKTCLFNQWTLIFIVVVYKHAMLTAFVKNKKPMSTLYKFVAVFRNFNLKKS